VWREPPDLNQLQQLRTIIFDAVHGFRNRPARDQSVRLRRRGCRTQCRCEGDHSSPDQEFSSLPLRREAVSAPPLGEVIREEGIIGRRRLLVPVPFAVTTVLARLFGLLPSPPLTTSQVDLLRTDNVASGLLPGFRELGIEPKGVEEVVPTYIGRSHVLEPH